MSATKWGYIFPFWLLVFHKYVYLGLCFHKQDSNHGSIQIQRQHQQQRLSKEIRHSVPAEVEKWGGKKKIHVKIVRHSTDKNVFNTDKMAQMRIFQAFICQQKTLQFHKYGSNFQ